MIKGLKEKASDYALNMDSIERWQDDAGFRNRVVIKQWANKRRELVTLESLVKERKVEVAEKVQDEKESGAKITDKIAQMMIDGDTKLQSLRQERDLLQIDIDELEKIMYLYRDLWNSAPTLRQSLNNMEKAEMRD